MNSLYKKIAVLAGMLLLSVAAFAQENFDKIEMAEGLKQSGKIYVVVISLSIIFTGIVAYLIMLDRKISKLERDIKNK
ncbi:MAG: CcmD family protein [Bacteroidetes bacterium]|nr:CcmD family protein [Bacteroidota bacterium]